MVDLDMADVWSWLIDLLSQLLKVLYEKVNGLAISVTILLVCVLAIYFLERKLRISKIAVKRVGFLQNYPMHKFEESEHFMFRERSQFVIWRHDST